MYFSYLQTIAAYPTGGGSYAVASQNLGAFAGLFAATALIVDYLLNDAVGISTGVSALKAATLWLVLRAFASGCTAMTGVEAVSNGVQAFRESVVKIAQRTLTIIIPILVVLLCGIGYLVHAYHIAATEPGRSDYESLPYGFAVRGRRLV